MCQIQHDAQRLYRWYNGVIHCIDLPLTAVFVSRFAWGAARAACFVLEAKLQLVNVRRVSGVYCVDWMGLDGFLFQR